MTGIGSLNYERRLKPNPKVTAEQVENKPLEEELIWISVSDLLLMAVLPDYLKIVQAVIGQLSVSGIRYNQMPLHVIRLDLSNNTNISDPAFWIQASEVSGIVILH